MITPYELELGLGAHEWGTCFLSSTSHAYRSQSIVQLVAKVEANRPEDPFDDGSEEGSGRDGDGSEPSSALITRNEEGRIVESFQSAAAERFASRDYKGMHFEVPEGQDLLIKRGQFGIAASYEYEST